MRIEQQVFDYPLFTPPTDLAEKPRANWTTAEARRYSAWLMSVIPERVGTFARWLELEPGGDPEAVLVVAGERMDRLLRLPGLSTPGRVEASVLAGHEVDTEAGPLVSATGYALAADRGLLMATMLRTACPELAWEIVTRPKSDAYYNLPVLRPFAGASFEPIGISLNAAHAVLQGMRPATAWRDIHAWWRGRCGTARGARRLGLG